MSQNVHSGILSLIFSKNISVSAKSPTEDILLALLYCSNHSPDFTDRKTDTFVIKLRSIPRGLISSLLIEVLSLHSLSHGLVGHLFMISRVQTFLDDNIKSRKLKQISAITKSLVSSILLRVFFID